MSEIKPMVVYPFDEEKEDQIHSSTPPQTPPGVLPPPRQLIQFGSGADSIERLILMISPLTEIKAFNKNFNIRGNNGEYIPNTNIAKLLGLTQHRVRSQKGVPEMLRLLYEAKIDPNLILNEAIKAKLIEMNSGRNKFEPQSPPMPASEIQSPAPEIHPHSPEVVVDELEMPNLDGPFSKTPIKRSHDATSEPESEVPQKKTRKIATVQKFQKDKTKRLRKIDQDSTVDPYVSWDEYDKASKAPLPDSDINWDEYEEASKAPLPPDDSDVNWNQQDE